MAVGTIIETARSEGSGGDEGMPPITAVGGDAEDASRHQFSMDETLRFLESTRARSEMIDAVIARNALYTAFGPAQEARAYKRASAPSLGRVVIGRVM